MHIKIKKVLQSLNPRESQPYPHYNIKPGNNFKAFMYSIHHLLVTDREVQRNQADTHNPDIHSFHWHNHLQDPDTCAHIMYNIS